MRFGTRLGPFGVSASSSRRRRDDSSDHHDRELARITTIVLAVRCPELSGQGIL